MLGWIGIVGFGVLGLCLLGLCLFCNRHRCSRGDAPPQGCPQGCFKGMIDKGRVDGSVVHAVVVPTTPKPEVRPGEYAQEPSGGVVWEWRADHAWVAYSPDVCAKLEAVAAINGRHVDVS